MGAGALGCEFLKNLALLSFCLKTTGKLTLIDCDKIEVSNLTRQFLFRVEDVGKSKAIVAKDFVLKFNKELAIEALDMFINKESEAVLTDSFWHGLDSVIPAVDNVATRQYLNEMCLYHDKPLWEAATEGLAGDNQVILPYLTVDYQSPPKNKDIFENIPICSLKGVPKNTNHIIAWVLNLFKTEFEVAAFEFQKKMGNLDDFFDGLDLSKIDDCNIVIYLFI